MTRNQWLMTLVGVLILGGGGYGACAMSGGTESDVAGVQIDPGDMPGAGVVTGEGPQVEMPDAGRALPELPVGEEPPNQIDDPAVQAATETAQSCSENRPCPVGERCCFPAGTCVPADCTDCCDGLMNAPGDPPRVIPDPPRPDER